MFKQISPNLKLKKNERKSEKKKKRRGKKAKKDSKRGLQKEREKTQPHRSFWCFRIRLESNLFFSFSFFLSPSRFLSLSLFFLTLTSMQRHKTHKHRLIKTQWISRFFFSPSLLFSCIVRIRLLRGSRIEEG